MTSPRETSPQAVLVNVGEIGAMPKENRVSKERGDNVSCQLDVSPLIEKKFAEICSFLFS